MSVKLLTFEDGVVRIDGEELPGILSDLRVSGKVRFDEQSVDKASGKKKTPQGWEDADISLTLYLTTDGAGTCYDKLEYLNGWESQPLHFYRDQPAPSRARCAPCGVLASGFGRDDPDRRDTRVVILCGA